MFTFSSDVPQNIRAFLIARLQAWIDRSLTPLFSLATAKYGLITFRRYPWPIEDLTTVAPAGEADKAALVKFSQHFGD
jgi:hypothetical protein